MIVCSDCGKRKKIQNPNRLKTWKCSTCTKKRQGGKIEIQCFDCRKTIEIRKSKVVKSAYYICGSCYKHHDTNAIDIFREREQIITHKFNAAGEMDGFDISYPTAELKESIERAKLILACALAQNQVEQKLKRGEQLNPHLN